MSKRIAVLGSGFGGLSAAARLAADGHTVDVYEKRDQPGGRAYVYRKDGFTFDGGPTVITAPFLFEEIFRKAGRTLEDYVTLTSLDPFYRIFNHEGRSFDYNSDTDFILEQIGQWNPDDRDGYLRFMHTTKAIFQKGFVELADKPFLKFSDMMRIAPELIKLQSYKRVYSYVAQFIGNEFLRRVFSFHPLLVGGNPFDTTSIYTLIHYLERQWGVHYAMGGTGSLVQALVTLIEELGGTLHLNAEVSSLLIANGKVDGLRLADGSEHKYDIVVSNADVAHTYARLVPGEHRRKYTDRKLDRMKYSMSLFVYYFGTNRRYTDSRLAHHNIILGERYRELLQDIFRRKVLAKDFSLYLHMPTITDPSLAPEGCESFYVLSPVPHLDSGVDWKEQAEPYRDSIISFLEEQYLPDLRRHIVTDHYIDPLHFRDTLNSVKGSAFGFEPLLTQSAWFRPHNRSEEFGNLYFVGAGTHPGAGLPGVLSSAKIVENLIRES